MKFNQGDCLAFELPDGSFLAGLISTTDRGKYDIVLTDYRQTVPPPPAHFQGCSLFATNIELGEKSIASLDVIVIHPGYADEAKEVQLITCIEIGGFSSSSGFTEITDTRELTTYFESGLRKREKDSQQQARETGEFQIPTFLNIHEFLNNIQPHNEFPTVKLYKEVNDITLYWQIYGRSQEPASLVIHWGTLGQTGQFIEVTDKALSELREMYPAQIVSKKAEGYQEREFHPMILQFKAADEWGGMDDLDFRNEIWEYLDPFLFWTGNGRISGGDIGSGTVNLFFEALDSSLAVRTIVQALQEKKVDRPYLIALEGQEEEVGDDDSFGIKVLYPENYEEKFFY